MCKHELSSRYKNMFTLCVSMLCFHRHRGPEDWWSNNATIEDWFDEMVGQANIINRFAGVRMEDIRGNLLTRITELNIKIIFTLR
jgi:hypothetical protein